MNPNAGRPLSTLEESRLTPRFCLPYASRFLFGGQHPASSSRPELMQAIDDVGQDLRGPMPAYNR